MRKRKQKGWRIQITHFYWSLSSGIETVKGLKTNIINYVPLRSPLLRPGQTNRFIPRASHGTSRALALHCLFLFFFFFLTQVSAFYYNFKEIMTIMVYVINLNFVRLCTAKSLSSYYSKTMQCVAERTPVRTPLDRSNSDTQSSFYKMSTPLRLRHPNPRVY